MSRLVVLTALVILLPALGCNGEPGENGDGDADIAYAEMHQGADPDEVVVFLNEARGESWHKQVLSNDGSHDIVLADFDQDGDLDIAGANHAGTHPLELWRNDRVIASAAGRAVR